MGATDKDTTWGKEMIWLLMWTPHEQGDDMAADVEGEVAERERTKSRGGRWAATLQMVAMVTEAR